MMLIEELLSDTNSGKCQQNLVQTITFQIKKMQLAMIWVRQIYNNSEIEVGGGGHSVKRE